MAEKKSSKAVAEETVAVELDDDVFVPEHVWTAQMIGKDFYFHHNTIHVLYDTNPMPRIDFTEQDTF